jgi:hypothetical protein
MTLSQHIIDELAKTVKPTTVKRYKAWSNIISPGGYKVDEFINFHKFIDDQFKSRKDCGSILSVIIKVLSIEGKDTELYQKLRNEVMSSKDLFEKPSEGEKEREISVDEVYSRRQQLLHKYFENPKRQTSYQLQYLYMITEIAPFRTQDYIGVSFSPDTSTNYVDMPNQSLVYNEGKTVNSKRTIKIPDDVFQIIKQNKERFKATYLFQSIKKGKSFSEAAIVSLVKDIFDGKNITPQLLRQIFVSHYNDTEMNKKDRIIKAHEMGHTFRMAETNYTKFSKAIHDKETIIQEQRDTIFNLRGYIKSLEDERSTCTC